MPIYEYRCGTCGRRQSVFWRSMSAVKEDTLVCEKCGGRKLSRLVSRVRMVRGGASAGSDDTGAGAGMDGMDESLMREMGNLDENDPRALGRLMRQMAAASGEDLGPEFGEVVGRLEKGEDPERIEREMGDMFGAEADGTDGMAETGGVENVEGDGAQSVEKARPKASRRRPAVKSKATSKPKAGAAKSTRKRSA